MNECIIIASDDTVIIDGKAHPVNCSPLRVAGIHAVHWIDGYWGRVEYQAVDFVKQAPTTFADMSAFQWAIDAWTAVENAPPPPPAPPDPRVAVAQSYASSLRRQADALHAQGNSYDAVKLLLKASKL